MEFHKKNSGNDEVLDALLKELTGEVKFTGMFPSMRQLESIFRIESTMEPFPAFEV
jgi:hypothetical protein